MALARKNSIIDVLNSIGFTYREFERLPGGANSQVTKAISTCNEAFIIKEYLKHPNDKRDRLGTEYKALKYLWDIGNRNIPEPIYSSDVHNLAIYRFISGRTLSGKEITNSHIFKSVRFFHSLYRQSHSLGADDMGSASAACFSIQNYFDQLNDRIGQLEKADLQSVSQFFRREFIPTAETITNYVQDEAQKSKIDLFRVLSKEEQTLSPSDVGFHNILCVDGELVFIDFEYFGWDDPAKLMSDFILHPGVPIKRSLASYFVKEMLSRFPFSSRLLSRFQLVFLIVGLIWCLIMLNPFLFENGNGRQSGFSTSFLEDRLNKTKQKLLEIKEYYHSLRFLNWGN